MAEEIVSCAGCGKKFRIPDGSPPTGSFACTACGADVAYGGVAVAKSRGSARKKPGSRGKPEPEPDRKPSRGVRRARGRKAVAEAVPDVDEGRGGRRGRAGKPEKENQTLPLIVAIMGIVLAAGILVVALTGEEPDRDAEARRALENRKANEAAAGNSAGISSSSTPKEAPVTTPTPAPTAGTSGTGSVAIGDPESGDSEEESGIGGVKGGDPSSRAHNYGYMFGKYHADPSLCFVDSEPLEGTTDAEVSELRALADKAFDFDAGRTGILAQDELIKRGRKSVPFILNQFTKHWNGGKWAEQGEQWAAWQVQMIVRRVTMKSGPPSQFVARFTPQGDVGPDKFQRAATMWIAWWRGEGMYLEEFEAFSEDEE